MQSTDVKPWEINYKQQKMAGLIMHSLKVNYNHHSKKIKAPQILARLTERGYKCQDAELRQILGHIRSKDLCSPGFILSDAKGYWYSEDVKELERVYKSQHSRAISILKNFAPLHRRFKHLLSEEDSLFKNSL